MSRIPRRVLATLILALASLLLASCGKDTGFSPPYTAPAGNLRLVNAVPDSPTLAFVVDGRNEANLQFGQASAFVPEVPNVPITFRIVYIESGEQVTLTSTRITIEKDRDFTVVATGTLDNPKLMMIDNPPTDFTDNPEAVEVQFAHAATDAGSSVSLFVDEGGTAATEPASTVSFGEFGEVQTLTSATDYTIHVRNSGEATDVWSAGPLNFAGSTRHLLLLVDYFGPGGGDARLLSIGDAGAGVAPNENLPAGIRIANMIADQGPVDVTIGGNTLAQNLAFGQVTGYVETTLSGDVSLTIAPTGQPDAPILEGTTTLASGQYRSLILSGLGDNISTATSNDDQRHVASRVGLALTHAAPSANPDASSHGLDVYLLEQGQDVTQRSPNASMGYLDSVLTFLNAGSYDLVLTNAGTNDIVFGPLRTDVADNGVYRVFVSDADGGGTPLQVVLDDDFTQ